MSKELITTQINVKDNLVSVMRVGDVDYISLTDLAKFKNDKLCGKGRITFKLEGHVYEGDFDDNGMYRGNSKYTVTING